MKILMVGGGSGGHVTPLKAVALEVIMKDPTVEVRLITDRRFEAQARSIFADTTIEIRAIFSGKLRRYHGKSAVWHLTHIPTLLKNLGDVFLVGVGVLQALLMLFFSRPNVVFSKGGFVAVPVAVAARLFNIPLIIHDSDTHPGLSNRIVARWATSIATGMPEKYYSYPQEKMVHTGIPVDPDYKPLSSARQDVIKNSLGFVANSPLLLVTGGGTGSERINSLIERVGESLIREGWSIAQITGKGKAKAATALVSGLDIDIQAKWHVHEFTDIREYTLAADVVISRAGATTLQELANAKKSVILIPNPLLTGGHQIKNAQMLEEAGAVRVLPEDIVADRPEILHETITAVLGDSKGKNFYASRLHSVFARPEAARTLADILISRGSEEGKAHHGKK